MGRRGHPGERPARSSEREIAHRCVSLRVPTVKRSRERHVPLRTTLFVSNLLPCAWVSGERVRWDRLNASLVHVLALSGGDGTSRNASRAGRSDSEDARPSNEDLSAS